MVIHSEVESWVRRAHALSDTAGDTIVGSNTAKDSGSGEKDKKKQGLKLPTNISNDSLTGPWCVQGGDGHHNNGDAREEQVQWPDRRLELRGKDRR